ncbi:MAG: hypothetical protein ACKPKO_45420, partial [Candidatus Fonsibacter sp.]
MGSNASEDAGCNTPDPRDAAQQLALGALDHSTSKVRDTPNLGDPPTDTMPIAAFPADVKLAQDTIAALLTDLQVVQQRLQAQTVGGKHTVGLPKVA